MEFEDPEVGSAGVEQGPDPQVLELVKPKATRLTRFKRLFMPSVGPLDTLASCQATMPSNPDTAGFRHEAPPRVGPVPWVLARRGGVAGPVSR